QGRPFYVPPRLRGQAASTAGPTNPCGHTGLFLPLTAEGQVAGVAEVWLPPDRSPGAIPGYLQFLGGLVQLASHYLERQRAREAHLRQQLWTDLEAFARRVHASL